MFHRRTMDPVVESQGLPLSSKDTVFKAVLATRGEHLRRLYYAFALSLTAPGREKGCCGRILVNLTYQEGKINKLLRLLPVIPLAYTSCMRLPTPGEAEESQTEWWMRHERGSETYIYGDGHADAALECDAVIGRLLFLRLLTKTLEICGGSLEAIPSLSRDPNTQNYLRQATSPVIVEKIARATFKRHIYPGLDTGNTYMKRKENMRARWKFLASSELTAVIFDLEYRPWFKEQWDGRVYGSCEASFVLLQRMMENCGTLELLQEAKVYEEAISGNPRYLPVLYKLRREGITSSDRFPGLLRRI